MAEEQILNCYYRTDSGKQKAKKMRRNEMLPGVIYGHNLKPVPIAVAEKEFLNLWRKIHGKQVVLDLIIHRDDKKEERVQGFLQDYQHSLLTEKFLHLDFHQVKAREKIRLDIPVELVGAAPGEKKGGVVDQLLREIEVEALPRDLPEKFTVSIDQLEMGDSIYVSDLPAVDGVQVLTNPEEPVVSVLVPRKEAEPEEVLPTEAPEESVEPEVISDAVAEERRKQKEKTKPE